MATTKIKSGHYRVTAHGFTFTLTKGDGRWYLWNKGLTEVMWASTKTAILNALDSYDKHGLESLDNQEWCAH